VYQELKVKKEDSQGLLGTIIVTFVCLGIGVGLFILARNVMNGTINSVNSGNPMTGYLVMGFGGIFFICGILAFIYMFKPVNRFNAQITDVVHEFYYESRITYIKFKVKMSGKSSARRSFEAYLEGEHDIPVGSSCTLYIKEFNWRVKGANFHQMESGASNTVAGVTFVPVYIGTFMILYMPLIGMIIVGIRDGFEPFLNGFIVILVLGALIGTYNMFRWRKIIKAYKTRSVPRAKYDYGNFFDDLDKEIAGEKSVNNEADNYTSAAVENDYYEKPAQKHDFYKIYFSTYEYAIKDENDILRFRFMANADGQYDLQDEYDQVVAEFVKDPVAGLTIKGSDGDINMNSSYGISGAPYYVEASAGTSRFFKIKTNGGVDTAYLFDKNDHYLLRYAHSENELNEMKIALGILVVN
jgi:hypothetical protein